MSKSQSKVIQAFNDTERMKAAIAKSVAEAVRRHKQMGHPVAVWRDGKEVWIPPEDLPDL